MTITRKRKKGGKKKKKAAWGVFFQPILRSSPAWNVQAIFARRRKDEKKRKEKKSVLKRKKTSKQHQQAEAKSVLQEGNDLAGEQEAPWV